MIRPIEAAITKQFGSVLALCAILDGKECLVSGDSPVPASIPLECLQASLARLMTRFACAPCAHGAKAILRLLVALVDHPGVVANPVLDKTYRSTLFHWRALASDCATPRELIAPPSARELH